MKKSTAIHALGTTLIFFLLAGVGANSQNALATSAPLRLSVYAPGSYGDAETLMQRYMVNPTDMITYQVNLVKEFQNITVMDGGPCLTCTSGKSVKKAIADAGKFGTEVIGYDFEHWTDTPATEQANPVGSVDTAAKMTHQAGLKFAFNPDGGYLWNRYNKTETRYYQMYHWQNVDVLVIMFQGKRFAGGTGTNVTDYENKVQTVVNYVKSKNPNIIVFAQLSFRFDTPQTINQKTQAISDIVDGVIYYYSSDNPDCTYCSISNLKIVLQALRPAL